MQAETRARGGGKTIRLINWMFEAPEGVRRVFVADTQFQAQAAWQLARDLFPDSTLERWQFISAQDLINNKYRGKLNHGYQIQLGVDNVDVLLTRWLGYPVAAVTITVEDMPI